MSDEEAEQSLGNRVTIIETTCELVRPEFERRLEGMEKKQDTMLQSLTAVETMLKQNGFGKKRNGNAATITQLKLEAKFSRWITGFIIAFCTIALAQIGIVIAIMKMKP